MFPEDKDYFLIISTSLLPERNPYDMRSLINHKRLLSWINTVKIRLMFWYGSKRFQTFPQKIWKSSHVHHKQILVIYLYHFFSKCKFSGNKHTRLGLRINTKPNRSGPGCATSWLCNPPMNSLFLDKQEPLSIVLVSLDFSSQTPRNLGFSLVFVLPFHFWIPSCPLLFHVCSVVTESLLFVFSLPWCHMNELFCRSLALWPLISLRTAAKCVCD